MTEEIVTIRLAGINNGAHYNFMSNVAEKAKGDEAVYGKAKSQTDALVSALAQENEDLMLSRKSSLSDTIAEADRQRDAYYRGYRNGVRSFRSFPAGAQKTAADTLWQHMTDHGIEPKMQLDRETGLLTNLVEDLQGRLAPQVAALGLKPFVDGMKAANETVRTSLSGRDTEQSGLTLGALKASRAKTDEAYQSLVRRVNAHAEIEGAGDYFVFITYVNEQIKRFKEQVLPSGKGSGKGTGSGKGSKGSGTGKGSGKSSVKKQLSLLIPAFETAQGLAAGSLAYAGHTGELPDGTKLYLLYVDGNPDNFVWVKIDGDHLSKVDYLAGAGKPGGVK